LSSREIGARNGTTGPPVANGPTVNERAVDALRFPRSGRFNSKRDADVETPIDSRLNNVRRRRPGKNVPANRFVRDNEFARSAGGIPMVARSFSSRVFAPCTRAAHPTVLVRRLLRGNHTRECGYRENRTGYLPRFGYMVYGRQRATANAFDF